VSIVEAVVEQIKALPENLQLRVLRYARTLVPTPPGVSGRQLLRFAGAISSDDLRVIQDAIEQGCERIDADEW
jgi:hypothetical protein